MHDAGIFLKSYLEFMEDLPDDISKSISIIREVNVKTKNLITEVEKISLATPSEKLTTKMHQILVKLTELKDEKIQLSQSITSQIENKYKAVADSYESNPVVKQERSPTPKIVQTPAATQSINKNPQPNPVNAPSTTVSSTSEEKTTKRVRKTRIDNLDIDSTDESIPPAKSTEKALQSSNTNKRGSTANTTAKKQKKRKTTKKQNAQAAQEAFDETIQDDNITDETTYCICQQISYGEMIFCENDTCPIEWFHFSCVDLTAKPKGRWFCPQCRGDKPNVINKNLRKKQQESSI